MGRAKKPSAPEPPSIEADTADFYEAFQEVLRLYQFRDRDRTATHGLSVNQCYALESIDRLGPLALNEVAARLALDKSSASRIVSSLEKSGLVRRQPLESDGRVLQIEATAAGADRHARIRYEIMERQQRLLSDFEPAVRRAMTRFLRKLARTFTNAGGSPACRAPRE